MVFLSRELDIRPLINILKMRHKGGFNPGKGETRMRNPAALKYEGTASLTSETDHVMGQNSANLSASLTTNAA